MKRYVFLTGLTVTQVIVGELSSDQLNIFVHDYRRIFGIDSSVIVEDDRPVWIGGSYDATSGEFSPPPSPEPEPEPIVEETTNDDAPII
jgi:hypothetical protein